MAAKANKIRCRRGVSLVGTMVAVVVLLIALIGTSNFRYFSALDARKADAQTTAARVALMLCEGWRGIRGDGTYNPTAHLGSSLTITQNNQVYPDKPPDFTLLGSYKVVLESVNYYTTLSWKDVQPGLRALNVVVAWAQRDQREGSIDSVDKSFKLTIYTSTL